MKRRLLISFCCLAAGLSAGIMLRSRTVSAEKGVGASPLIPGRQVDSASPSPAAKRVIASLNRALPERTRLSESTDLLLEDLRNVEALSSADFPVVLAQVKDPGRTSLLMERWAEVDAKGLAAWLEPLARLYDPGASRWRSFSNALQEEGLPLFNDGVLLLSRVDPEAALDLKRKAGKARPEFVIASGINKAAPPPPSPPDPDFAAMSGSDAWRWLREHQRTNDLHSIAEKLTKSDPERAVAWLESMPLISDRASLLKSALLEVIRKNPERLPSLLDRFSGEDVAAALSACQGLSAASDAGIEEWAAQCSDPAARRAVFRWLAEKRIRGGAEKAWAWAEQLSGTDRWSAMERLASSCPDPAGMARSIAAGTPPPEESSVLVSLAGRWAEKDREAVLAWARSLPAGTTRTQAVEGAWAAWMQADSAAAQRAVLSLPETDRRAGIRGVVASWWAREYPGKALEWIATLPPENQPAALAAARPELFQGAAGRQVPALLTRLADHPVPPEDASGFFRLVRSVTVQESFRAAEAVKSWAVALPPGEIRREALTTLAGELLGASWEKGSAWIASLPAEDQRAIRE